MAKKLVGCDRCRRIRYEDRMEQAVFVRADRNGDLHIAGKANAYRCTAYASCDAARRQVT